MAISGYFFHSVIQFHKIRQHIFNDKRPYCLCLPRVSRSLTPPKFENQLERLSACIYISITVSKLCPVVRDQWAPKNTDKIQMGAQSKHAISQSIKDLLLQRPTKNNNTKKKNKRVARPSRC